MAVENMQAVLTKDVEIRNAYKSYGSNVILNGISLDVRQGELLTLLGPSGCGKTTTLNVIAGFIEIDDGEVLIKGNKMNHIPPHKRDLGMVFQTYSLFPHMTVYQNLDFGLNLRKVDKAERNRRIGESLELVKMTGLENRYPRELSGGQRQRVAIARALVVHPKLLLLDEPLSNLDAKLRHELRAEIKRLQKEVGVTTIFVTHDQEEALSMSDRIVVMNKGNIEQIGTPIEIYKQPKTEFVFQFIGKSNCFDCSVQSIGEKAVHVQMESGSTLSINESNRMDAEQTNYHVGDKIKVYIRPEQITIEALKSAVTFENSFSAEIVQMNYLGTTWEIEVSSQGKLLQLLSPTIDPIWTSEREVVIGWNSSDMMMIKK
jgi:putative spermidine/putrescine transport system ATP-binding protein